MEDNMYSSLLRDTLGAGHKSQAPHRLEHEIEELMRTSQLRLLLLHTAFIVLLLRRIITSPGWELWAVPLLLLGEAALWIMRLREMFPMRMRNYIIIIYSLLSIFFYGIHPDVFSNIPLLLSLFIMAYSTVGDFFTIKCGVICYAALLMYHILVTGAFQAAWAADANITAVQILTVIFVIPMFARFFISDRFESAGLREGNISRITEENTRRSIFFADLIRELKSKADSVYGKSQDLCNMLAEGKQSGTGTAAADLRNAGKLLADRLNSMMICSDVMAGSVNTLEERWHMSDLFARITDFSEELLSEKDGIDIIYDFSPDMPSEMLGDIDKLSEAARRIIENAVKFTEYGGVCISVFTRSEPYGVNVCIQVSDTGPGMETEDRSIVSHGKMMSFSGHASILHSIYTPEAENVRGHFGPFHNKNDTAPKSAESDRRHGLGLPIARGLARAMGGFVIIHSAQLDGMPSTQSGVSMRENFVRVGTSVMLCVPQRVSDPKRWISQAENKKAEVLIFIRNKEPRSDGMAQRMAHSAVREFRSRMISRMAHGLSVSVSVSSSIEEARAFVSKRSITHLIISEDDFIRAHGGCSVCRRIMEEHAGRLCTCSILGVQKTGECLWGQNASGIKVGVFTPDGGRAAREPEGCRGVFTLRSPFSVVSMAEFMSLTDDARPSDLPLPPALPKALSAAMPFTAEKQVGAEDVPNEDTPAYQADESSAPRDDGAVQAEQASADDDRPLIERLRDAGVNVESALEYCGGMEDMYIDMVQDFCAMTAEKAEELGERLACDDADGYRIKVHSLKSNLRTLGFDEQADIAFELETLCKEGRWEDVRTQHRRIIEALNLIRAKRFVN